MRVFQVEPATAAQLVYSPDGTTLAASLRANYRARVVFLWNLTDDSAKQLRFDPADYQSLLTFDELVTGKRQPFPKIAAPRRANHRSRRTWVCRARSAPVFGVLWLCVQGRVGSPITYAVRVRHADAPRPHPPIEWEMTFRSAAPAQVDLDADGSRVVMLAGPTVRVWEVATGAELATIRNRRLTPAAAEFSADGRYLGVLYQDSVSLYDTASWTVAKTYSWKVGKLRTLAFSPDGATAAVGSDKGKIVVFDLE